MTVNSNHLKKYKTLVQFSDGSSSYLLSSILKKELVLELDLKTNNYWKNKNLNITKNIEERSIHFSRKFFKHKS